jgi:hypothetical protein
MPATDLLVWRLTVRLGSTSSSWIALEKLMSFLGVFFPLQGECLRVSKSAVSGLDETRARVCEAFFLSFPVRTESRSNTIM